MMNLILSLGLATTYLAQPTLTKEVKPYCGAKNKMLHFCKVDDDCKYSDEVCNEEGYCYPVQFIWNDCATREKELTPYCGAKYMMMRECKTSWDCSFTDEYCDQGWCMTDASLYDNYDCLDGIAVQIAEIAKSSEEQKKEALRDRDCAVILCPP